CQIERLVVDARDVRLRIHAQPSDGRVRLLRRGGRSEAQQSANAGTLLACAAGLLKVGVRTEIEELCSLVRSALAGQHEDRRRRRCADPLAHFVARELRELAVEYHKVRRFLSMPPERGLAVIRGDDFVALLAQERRDHPDERALVVDHEDRAQRNAGSAVARASGTVNAKTAPPPSGEASTQMSPP